MTPGKRRRRSCMPQKQPPAKMACSVVPVIRVLLSLQKACDLHRVAVGRAHLGSKHAMARIAVLAMSPASIGLTKLGLMVWTPPDGLSVPEWGCYTGSGRWTWIEDSWVV